MTEAGVAVTDIKDGSPRSSRNQALHGPLTRLDILHILRTRLVPLLRGDSAGFRSNNLPVRGTYFGDHARRRPGPGEDFWDYRPHLPQEDVSDIDWRRSARSNQPMVKRYELKAARKIGLHIPALASLAHAFDGAGIPLSVHEANSKVCHILLLTMLLAHHFLKAGDHVILAHQNGPAFRSTTQFDALCLQLVEMFMSPDGQWTHVTDTDRDAHMILRQRPDMMVVLSDFWVSPDQLEIRLKRQRLPHLSTQLVRVISPGEIEFPFKGPYRLQSSDGRKASKGQHHMRLDIGPETRKAYQQAFQSHHADLVNAAFQYSAPMHLHLTDRPILPLFHQISHLMENHNRTGGAL